jgi:imidazolonepropionase-like amidohydrolase
VALAIVLFRPAPSPGARGDVLAVVGARVVTVSGAVHESATLVMRDGLITAVGPSVAAPAEARVIEGGGLTLTPGLIDGFGGIGLPAAPPRPAGGASERTPGPSPSPLTPQASTLDRLRPAEALKARDTGVTTALVVPREGVLPGRSVLVNLAGESAEGMVLRQPAALHVHMATLARRYPNSLMGTMALVRQSLLDAVRYREEWTAYERAPAGRTRPRYDPGLEAWTEVAAGRLPLVITATRENDVRRAAALADEFKVKVAVAGAPQAFQVAELLKARRLPLLVSVNFDPPRPVSFFGAADDEKQRQDIEEAEKNPARLHEAGVRFALVSGHAPDFLKGVQKAIERGLPREAALRAVTLGAAEALGIADRTGSLEAGKMANVVAWSGEPLARDARVKMVFVDGELYEPEEPSPPPSPAPPAEVQP